MDATAKTKSGVACSRSSLFAQGTTSWPILEAAICTDRSTWFSEALRHGFKKAILIGSSLFPTEPEALRQSNTLPGEERNVLDVYVRFGTRVPVLDDAS